VVNSAAAVSRNRPHCNKPFDLLDYPSYKSVSCMSHSNNVVVLSVGIRDVRPTTSGCLPSERKKNNTKRATGTIPVVVVERQHKPDLPSRVVAALNIWPTTPGPEPTQQTQRIIRYNFTGYIYICIWVYSKYVCNASTRQKRSSRCKPRFQEHQNTGIGARAD
jgi:hypothetical protein